MSDKCELLSSIGEVLVDAKCLKRRDGLTAVVYLGRTRDKKYLYWQFMCDYASALDAYDSTYILHAMIKDSIGYGRDNGMLSTFMSDKYITEEDGKCEYGSIGIFEVGTLYKSLRECGISVIPMKEYIMPDEEVIN